MMIDDFFQESDGDKHGKDATRTKKQWSNDDDDDDDDWFNLKTNTKKPTTASTVKQQDRGDDDIDLDDGWNRTGGSTASYVPSFGASGPLISTFNTQGQDTIQRIVSQPRPATSSGSNKFEDLFGNSPPKTTTSIDAEKSKKTVRFDDFDLTRPSTAPSPADTLPNRSTPGVISSMRTGLEPNRSFGGHGSTKTTTESNKTDNWLNLTDEVIEEDEPPPPRQKIEPTISTLVKKNPLAPVQETPVIGSAPPKKNVLESFLDDDRQFLSQNTPVPPSNKPSQSSWLEGLTGSSKRPATAESSKSPSFIDTQQTKASSKPMFEPTDDLANQLFKDPSKSSVFGTDQQIFTGLRPNSSVVNYDAKRFEFENNELKMTVDHMKRQHEVEVSMLEESYKHRLEYVEKSCERREARLKEENEHLLRQLTDRTQQYENEKSTLISDHQRRLDDLQRDRTNELENLRTLQRQTVDHLRREHEQTIQRLKQLKQEEISTALDVTTHTRAFESVVDHMEKNTKNIDELRLKIEAKHSSVLTDKEIEARAKSQQLKAYEERLQMQTTDFERERKNLQELVSRLEVHLSEQTKLVEEERWKALQAQKRMEAMQDALNGEQRLYMEKFSRDRSEIQRSKDQLLEDQKVALASIYESRSQLADERAKVEALQKAFQEQKHRDLLQNTTMEAETRAQQKLAAEQLLRLEKREQELIKREESLLLEKRSLAELKQRLDLEQSTIKTQQDDFKEKLNSIEHANELVKKEKERLSQLYFELHAMENKNTSRLQQLQTSISHLRQQEDHMNERHSRTPNDLRSSVSFKNKSSPVIDSGFSTLQLAGATPLHSSTQSIEESAVLRTLRMNDLQDQLYIQDELSFLNSLRAGNHLPLRSTSFSNLHRQSESHLLRTNY